MIIFASFPRSGHHFIINTLSKIDRNISYCEKYKCEDQFGKKIDCTARNLHLSQRQICKAGKRIQKTHDFLLNEPIIKKDEVKYFSLIRHPVPAIISRWKLNEASLIKRNPNIDKTFPLIAPADAPMKSAGENIPPKSPNPMHAEVAIIFAMKRTAKERSTKLPLCISDTAPVPKPKISGMKIPIDPQKTAAIKRFVEGE